jgi:hypothetical protein
MNRCTPHLMAVLTASLMLLAAAASFVSPPALAQTDDAKPTVREFPKAALRGEMVVLMPPEISMNGKPERLSPGARIRDANNHLAQSGALLNQQLLVNYLRDNLGQVHEVWILNSEEAREKRAGLQTRNFSFGSEASAAPQDDGKTPYDQLPGFKQ